MLSWSPKSVPPGWTAEYRFAVDKARFVQRILGVKNVEFMTANLETSEFAFLGTFDANRDKICAVGSRLNVRGRKDCYELGADDF